MENKKEEVTLGAFGAGFIISGILILMFIWSPLVHYLGKWHAYWNTETSDIPITLTSDLPKNPCIGVKGYDENLSVVASTTDHATMFIRDWDGGGCYEIPVKRVYPILVAPNPS